MEKPGMFHPMPVAPTYTAPVQAGPSYNVPISYMPIKQSPTTNVHMEYIQMPALHAAPPVIHHHHHHLPHHPCPLPVAGWGNAGIILVLYILLVIILRSFHL